MKRTAVAAATILVTLAACGTPTVHPGSGPAASSGSSSGAKPASKKAAPTVATFNDKYVYPDKLEVEVTKVSSAKLGQYASLSDGKAKAGTKYSVLKVRVRNGSKTKVNAIGSSQVSYGPDGDPAVQVFDQNVGQGMTGTVLPGKAKTATYGFIVPTKYLGDATLEFTADFDHPAAVFSGSLK